MIMKKILLGIALLLIVLMPNIGCEKASGGTWWKPHQLYAYFDEVHNVVIVTRPTTHGGVDAIPADELKSFDSELFTDSPLVHYWYDSDSGLCIWYHLTTSGGVAILPESKVSNPNLPMNEGG